MDHGVDSLNFFIVICCRQAEEMARHLLFHAVQRLWVVVNSRTGNHCSFRFGRILKSG